ncbi:MAG: TonB-dependent receptor plug domain-containing protein [bacterium]|nr:MAG: TonB-dependent receptor plug domain-containing protein [bacterium]
MNVKEVTYLFIFFLTTSLFPNEIVLEGKVRDSNTYREISEVNIFISGFKIGTTSDVSGKFRLKIPRLISDMEIVFQHVAYDTLILPVQQAISRQDFYLQEKVIPLPAVDVVAEAERLEIKRDLPQSMSVYKARDFEFKGYTDAGDLLRTDHAVQIDEDLNGKKLAAIRGGNPDEVVVLYNGIKLNSNYDNIFDLSLIDLDDIKRFEVIKGSNTTLYGPEAFSGVINIVPKLYRDYKIRFKQRIGSYNSGDWSLGLNQKINNFNVNYSIRKGASTRDFAEEERTNAQLLNAVEYHQANAIYSYPEPSRNPLISEIGMMYIRSRQDFDNQLDNETLLNFNQMISLNYTGNWGKLREIKISGAYQWLEEEQFLLIDREYLDRDIGDRAFSLKAEKDLNLDLFKLFFGYQYRSGELKYIDDRTSLNEIQVGLQEATINRTHHGFASIAKFSGPTGSTFIDFIDFDMSLRYDRVKDRQTDAMLRGNPMPQQQDSTGVFNQNLWEDLTLKFSSNFGGGAGYFAFNAFMNYGTNVKFPTLFQQISTPGTITSQISESNDLNPEKNRSTEVGLVFMREMRQYPTIFGWELQLSYFKNEYENKFRTYYTPGIPIAFYDNVSSAAISGIEIKPSLYLFKKKVLTEFGYSKYNISEKSAFPFKYDFKYVFNLMIDHAGYGFHLMAFKEGEQSGWIRQTGGELAEITLPAYANIDVHFNKTFDLKGFKTFFNASFRNILSTEYIISGLALRDRRYYLTVGIQY